ncbi:MAG: hypothetical protein M1823_002225, partial [Watsoniomyces obsoletus]
MVPTGEKVKRKRGRPSRAELAARRASQGISDDANAGAPIAPQFPSLEPQIKRVAPDVVNSKWSNLSPPAQEQVRDLFRTVARPLLMRYRDEERRLEAQEAIGDFLETLDRKLPRFPFPPGTRDAHFDYEKLLDSNVRIFLSFATAKLDDRDVDGSQRTLEAQLTPATHSIGLLKEAIRQEEAALEIEKRRLEALERETSAEEAIRGKHAKPVPHPLLQRLNDDAAAAESDPSAIALITHETQPTLSFDKDDDPELAEVLRQLHSRLKGMRDNATQASNLNEAVWSAQAAVDDLLYSHLTSA